MSEQKTLLAIGAHVDDCVFGLPGTMIKAARQGHRVVILTLIGKPADRERVSEISRGYGAEMVFLGFLSGRFEADAKTKVAVANVVTEVGPDVAFHPWPYDTHADHVAAAPICQAALLLGGRLTGREEYRPPTQVYAYDNGPRHTIGFVPDTFVDISAEWTDAMEWLGKLDPGNRTPYDPAHPSASQRAKEAIAAYRGATCMKRYAEAFWTASRSAVEIF